MHGYLAAGNSAIGTGKSEKAGQRGVLGSSGILGFGMCVGERGLFMEDAGPCAAYLDKGTLRFLALQFLHCALDSAFCICTVNHCKCSWANIWLIGQGRHIAIALLGGSDSHSQGQSSQFLWQFSNLIAIECRSSGQCSLCLYLTVYLCLLHYQHHCRASALPIVCMIFKTWRLPVLEETMTLSPAFTKFVAKAFPTPVEEHVWGNTWWWMLLGLCCTCQELGFATFRGSSYDNSQAFAFSIDRKIDLSCPLDLFSSSLAPWLGRGLSECVTSTALSKCRWQHGRHF